MAGVFTREKAAFAAETAVCFLPTLDSKFFPKKTPSQIPSPHPTSLNFQNFHSPYNDTISIYENFQNFEVIHISP